MISSYEVKCPYCETPYDFGPGDDWRDEFVNDDQKSEYECDDCGRLFEIVCHTTHRLEAQSPED